MPVQIILNEIGAQLVDEDPRRVVINETGESVSPARAAALGILHDIIFIRGDGWTLAASADLESVAYELWKSEWIGFVREDCIVHPISEYPAQ